MNTAQSHRAALDELFQPYNRSDAPGLVVGVALRGKVLYRRGFGLASVEHGVANTPATRMRIASTTKHFVCLGALLLMEDGKLDIDAPVTTYLPELSTPRGAPTLRQFMNHTSGYRCYLDMLLMATGLTSHPTGRVLALQARQTDVNFAPGEKQLYCNGAYNLLSIAIERVAGMPFERFMKEQVFTPLGMCDTECVPSDLMIVPGMATLHMPASAGVFRRGLMMSEEVRGDGAIVSTVDDMIRWMAHLRRAVRGEPQLGRAESWRQMLTPAQLNNRVTSTYALGLNLENYLGVDTISHAGGAMGGTAQMLTAPAHGLDIIIMANAMTIDSEGLAQRIVDTVLADHLTQPAPKRPAAERFKHLHGAQYHSPTTGVRIGFDASGDLLALSMFNLPPAPLLFDEGETLRIGFARIVMGPFVWRVSDLAPAPDGAPPATLPYTDGGEKDVLTLLPAVAPDTSKTGQALVGCYRSQDLGATATVAFENDQLVMRFVGDYGGQAMIVQALSDQAFTARPLDRTLPFGYGVSLRHDRAGVVGFDIGSGRTRALNFVRIKARDGAEP